MKKMIIENGKVTKYCCVNMEWQFGNFRDLKKPEEEGELQPFFFYDNIANEVLLYLLERWECGNKDCKKEHDSKYFLANSFYTISYCPFCGEKIEKKRCM